MSSAVFIHGADAAILVTMFIPKSALSIVNSDSSFVIFEWAMSMMWKMMGIADGRRGNRLHPQALGLPIKGRHRGGSQDVPHRSLARAVWRG